MPQRVGRAQIMMHGEIADAHESLLAGHRLTTPFEHWCESHGVHPAERGAWELYLFLRPVD
jgi:hypothetical protein